MKHHVCAWYVRTLLYVHVCTDIAQYITSLKKMNSVLRKDDSLYDAVIFFIGAMDSAQIKFGFRCKNDRILNNNRNNDAR